MFRFESPIYLLLLILLPLLFYLEKRPGSFYFLRTNIFKLNKRPGFFFNFNESLKYLTIFFLIIGAANPQKGEKKSFYDSNGVNIMLAIDTSGSMKALDMDKSYEKNRLDAVKEVVKSFIAKRNGDRIGVAVFGTNAFTLAPLTRDYKSIDFFMDKILIGMAGEKTAIGDAIAISVKRLEDVESKTKIIILLTDGESNSGEISPIAAAEAAGSKGVKIYSIGIGSNGYAPFPGRDIFGRSVIKKGRVNLDEKTLERISSITGGQYFNGKNKDELDKIYSRIDSLEKTTLKVETWKKDKDYYLYFLLTGLGLYILRLILTNTRFLKLP